MTLLGYARNRLIGIGFLFVLGTPGQTSAPLTAPSAKPAAQPSNSPPTSASDMMRAAAEKQRAAIAIQKEAARKHAQTAGLRMEPWAPAAIVTPDCKPVEDAIIAPIIETAARAHDIRPALIRAVMEQESAMRPCAISAKGAEGLMQLMPETCAGLGVNDPFDINENVEAGSKYLKTLIDLFKGDLRQALGAYNAGPTAAAQAGGVPDIPETRDYVDAIMKKLGKRP